MTIGLWYGSAVLILPELLDGMEEGIAAFDAEGHILYLNELHERLLGKPCVELLGQSLWTLFPQEVGQPFHQAFLRVAQGGIPESLERQSVPWQRGVGSRLFRTQSGHVCVVTREFSAREGQEPLHSGGLPHPFLLGAALSVWVEDLSQVSALLAKLRTEGGTDVRAFCEAHPDFVQQAVRLVRVLDVNDATVRLFEARDKAEVLGALPRIFLPETLPSVVEELVALSEGRTHFKAEAVMQTLRGRRIHVLLTLAVPAEGTGFQTIVTLSDITERKAAEAERVRHIHHGRLMADVGLVLTQSRTLHDMLHGCAEGLVWHLGAAFAGIWLLDESTHALQLQASSGLLIPPEGLQERVPLGDSPVGRIAQDRAPFLTNVLAGEPSLGVLEWAPQENLVSLAGTPLLLDERLVGVVAIFGREPLTPDVLDVLRLAADSMALGIERLRHEDNLREALLRMEKAEAQARESERTLETLMGNLPGMAYRRSHEPPWRLAYASEGGGPLTGYDFEDFQAWGVSWGSLVHPDDVGGVAAGMEAAIGAREPFTLSYRIRTRAGEERWVWDRGRGIFSAEGQLLAMEGFVADVTAQRRAEEERQKLVHVVERSSDFVGIADTEGRMLFVNEAGLKMVGLGSLEAARGTRILDYFTDEDRPFGENTLLPVMLREGRWEGEYRFRHFQTGQAVPTYFTLFTLRHPQTGALQGIATVTRDITQAKRQEAERAALLEREKAARADSERANQLKDEFLATVSHELRTPLTAMLGWVQMLRTGSLPDHKRQRALETVERNARAQAQLIEDLLDVSRIMSGKLKLEVETVEMTAIVEQALESVRPAADAKGIHLQAALDATGSVLGDAHRLQQVVWNLLSNAVKFTSKGGRVQVMVERQDASVEVTVTDTGAGIPPAFLPHVFERFRQAEGGTSRQYGGLGLGLSIVRNLVEMHGGTVSAQSEGEGQGAAFTVRLPLLMAVRKDVAPPLAPREAPLREPPACPPELSGLHVLVVDDEEDTREMLRTLLEGCRARVTCASSAAQGLALLREHRPDALVSDIGMPGEDGYSFIRKVRALDREEGGRTPAVALTAYARMEDRTRALLAGFQSHCPKPVEPMELMAVLASLCSQVGLETEG
ncbi:ATP-binding protein [Stigmatella hybrida]|uniref:ATP-binding protein n=1 Tax=Stigmatella hybrida TaxID=394097 RepID=UPI001CDA7997|nr:ATP-binding protein [Stigmatella hybrida]